MELLSDARRYMHSIFFRSTASYVPPSSPTLRCSLQYTAQAAFLLDREGAGQAAFAPLTYAL